MEHALTRKVALATPSTLLALLKTVATIWQQSVVTDEARELLNLGRTLYQRLSVFAGHADKVGRSLESAVVAYNKMVGSLERQVLSTARRFPAFDEADLTQVRELDEEKTQVRQLTKPELLEGGDAQGAQALGAEAAPVPAYPKSVES
jgi:DNA recombination protein RmuC